MFAGHVEGTNPMPSRDTLIRELARLRDLGESRDDEASQFVGTEARVALHAVIQAIDALARDEIVGGLQFLRLILEIAIRVRWIAFEGEEVSGEDGQPKGDPAAVRSRQSALRKRDLLSLAAAYRAITSIDTDAPRTDLYAGLRAKAAELTIDPAPAMVSELATSQSGRRLYAGHRLCSTFVHAGASLGRGTLADRSELEGMVDFSAYQVAAFADCILRALT